MRFSIKSLLLLITVTAIIYGFVIPAVLPFKPSLKFDDVHVTSIQNADGTTAITIRGRLRNTGREWLRFPARHTQISGCYALDGHLNNPLRFDDTGIVDSENAGLGPAQSMDLNHTVVIPHSNLENVSVTLSLQACARYSQPGATRYGWADSQVYKIEEP